MLNNDWIDRGVGHLYLKPCSPDKTQLLIRSDTTLGLHMYIIVDHLHSRYENCIVLMLLKW